MDNPQRVLMVDMMRPVEEETFDFKLERIDPPDVDDVNIEPR
jgi:hypothetical protein